MFGGQGVCFSPCLRGGFVPIMCGRAYVSFLSPCTSFLRKGRGKGACRFVYLCASGLIRLSRLVSFHAIPCVPRGARARRATKIQPVANVSVLLFASLSFFAFPSLPCPCPFVRPSFIPQTEIRSSTPAIIPNPPRPRPLFDITAPAGPARGPEGAPFSPPPASASAPNGSPPPCPSPPPQPPPTHTGGGRA